MDMQMDPGNVQEATLTLASRSVLDTHQKSTAPASRAARQDALSNEDAAHGQITDNQIRETNPHYSSFRSADKKNKCEIKSEVF